MTTITLIYTHTHTKYVILHKENWSNLFSMEKNWLPYEKLFQVNLVKPPTFKLYESNDSKMQAIEQDLAPKIDNIYMWECVCKVNFHKTSEIIQSKLGSHCTKWMVFCTWIKLLAAGMAYEMEKGNMEE